MANTEFDSAALFTPGRGSYVTCEPDNVYRLHLTTSSQRRGLAAAEHFDPDYHDMALFAGGYPGLAEGWPDEHIPPLGHREADLMSADLKSLLRREGWTEEAVAKRVHCQGESTNSIGDVRVSIEKGLLDPNIFHQDNVDHGLDLVTGALHGVRFRMILAKALDISPDRIRHRSMRDAYGTPSTEFRGQTRMPRAVINEMGAIALTYKILRHTQPGDLASLRRAEGEFIEIATSMQRS